MKAKFILYQAWVRHGLGLGLGLLVLAQCQLSGSLFSVKNVCSDRASHDMFACGEGTSTSPFVIASDEQLNNTPDFLDSHFEVARDLDMDGILRQPIGTDTTPFTGSFKGLRPNGQPAVISNVMINMPGSDNIGFFGAATNSATIENVGLENVMIVGRTNVGGLVGRNDGAGRISNSYATGTVEGDSEVGGLVGRNSATIFNSYATGRVTGTNQVGGLVGESNADTISNSYAAGAVTGMGNSVGGLVGNNDDSTIFNSYATGTVTGTNQVGGLVGESNADTISNSYATGAVTGMGNSVGGLVGNNDDSTIFNSYATGTVTGTNQVGGLVGESNADTISNSYATGAVTGMGNSVGGLVGDNESTISNSYATGNVTGTGSAIGGFVGLNNSTIDEINYFVDSDGVNGVGSGSCNGTCERRNENAILGYTNSVMNVDTINVSGLDSWDPNNWDFRSSISPQQHPAVKYAPFDADDDSIIDTAEGCGSLCGQLLPKQGEDDDNDSIPNNIDRCPTGTPGPSNTTNTMADDGDFDMDGCKNTEDTDDDNDGVVDISDTCPRGVTGWTSGPSTDSNGDGCRDSDEDLDAMSVAAAKAALTPAAAITYTAGDTMSSVTRDVSLTTTDPSGNGVTIAWSSGNTAVISNSGSVTRPSTNTMVTLTATLNKGTSEDTKTFILTVIISDAGAVDAAKAALTPTAAITYTAGDTMSSVTRDVTLTTTDPTGNGVAVSWTSGNTAVISNNGTVTRPSTNTMVTLTATLSKGSASGTRNFMLTVIISDAAVVAAARAALTIGYGGSDTASSVTRDVTLTTTDPTGNGVAVSWTSGNTAVISNNGTVTRPSTDTMVTLTAALSKGSASGTRNFMLTVILSDAAVVAAAGAALTIGYGGSDTASSVTQNVTLSTTDPTGNGVAVFWTSGNTAVISNNGTVTRPSTDTMVTLTATLSKGSASGTRNFMLTVILSDAAAVAAAGAALTIGYGGSDTASSVTQNVTLSTTDPTGNGVAVFWTSGNTAVISNNGTITRPSTNTMVTLTAALSKGSASGTRNFMLTVILSDAAAVAAARAALTIGYGGSDTASSVTQNVTLTTTDPTGNGVAVSWTSGNTAVISNNGTVTRPSTDTMVTLTAALSKGSASGTRNFMLTVIISDASVVAAARAALTIGYGGSDTASSVTQNVTLTTTDPTGNGVAVSWTSGNTAVISNNGTVTRPSTNTMVTLTATLSKGSASGTRNFMLTVIISDASVVAAARAALTIGYGGSDTASSVTQNVTLSTTDPTGNGVAVSWTSGNTAVISNNGTVTRPSTDTMVTLTAALSKGSASGTRNFMLTVIMAPPDADSDGTPDSTDVDEDGDGLIEIRNLNMLDNVRNTLDGTAYNDGGGDNTTGCGGQTGITSCSGYELSRDLDFGSAASYASGSINSAWRPTGGNPGTAINAGWVPIGDNSSRSDATRFTAIFDGNGHSISNLYVRVALARGRAYAGLFGYTGSGAVIRNTGVVAAAVFASFSVAYAGGLVGWNDGGSISNSYATGSVSASSSGSGGSVAYAGGLVGRNYNGSISNSYATGSVSAVSFFSAAGGLVGRNRGSISNSYATGSVSASAFASAYAGGLVGVNTSGGSISNSYATGSVSASSSSSGAYAGGLMGWFNASTGIISNSYATGSVVASNASSRTANAGGLVGFYNSGSISNSYWDRDTATLEENGVSRSGDLGRGRGHTGVTALSSSQMQAMSGIYPGLLGDDFKLDTSGYPPLKYGGMMGTDCRDSDDTSDDTANLPVCGTLLPGQEVRMASGFLRFSNTVIGRPSVADPVFAYDIGDTNTSIAISGTGVNGTTAGSYAIEDASGTALTAPTVSGTTISDLDSLSAGDEFYLKVTFTKGSDSFTQRYRFRLPDMDSDGIDDFSDVDDDGDGLIEIRNLNMLDNVRNTLDGTAYNDGDSDNTRGCGGQTGITSCSGYELSRDLDFGSAASYASGSINSAWRPTGGNPGTAINAGWVPIGDNSTDSDATRFTAIFEGNGHSISNLYVRVAPASGDAWAGLFGYTGSGAAIRNTGVVAAAVFASAGSARAYAGGLVGWNNSGSGSISNSYATGSVSASSSGDDAFAGGLVGFNNRGSISNSYATGSASASASNRAHAGGLVGEDFGGSISNSYATGSVSASASSFSAYAGGLVGLFNSRGSISNSYATGSASASSFDSSANAGGLVGFNNRGSISNSYATGSVSASASSFSANAGGLVGINTGSISNSYATGSVSASSSGDDAFAGGLVGFNNRGSISNSYATGSASASASNRAHAGGLVGEDFGGSISNSYATGSVSASASSFSANAGGLVGFNDGGSISNSYATGSVSAFSSGSLALAGGLVGRNHGGIISNSYATGSVSAFSSSSFAGGLVGFNSGTVSISNSYWDRGTVVLIEDGAIVSAEDQDIGDTGDHAGATALSSSQMQATSGTYPNLLGADFNLGTSSEYPLLEYGGTVDTDCKNSGDADLPVCGTLLPAQEVRMVSGFLRFSNTAIGRPSSTDFVFFYDIEDTATSIAISGTGVNGTTAGSYAIEDAAGTALTVPTVSGTTISALGALSAGDEFYLSATFTKDLNGDGDTSDSGESFTQRYRFKK